MANILSLNGFGWDLNKSVVAYEGKIPNFILFIIFHSLDFIFLTLIYVVVSHVILRVRE